MQNSFAGITVFVFIFLIAGHIVFSDFSDEQNKKTVIHTNEKVSAEAFEKAAARAHIVRASWYGRTFQGKSMANGKPFNMHALTIAHKTLPLGTKVLLQNPRNGRKAVVTVTDRGPYVAGRDIDLSLATALRLGTAKEGVARIRMARL